MPLAQWEQAVHTYEPGSDGKCQGGWRNDHNEWIVCGSSQRSSVLHDDPEAAFRQVHDHGGGDCMCFEDDDDGSRRRAAIARYAR